MSLYTRPTLLNINVKIAIIWNIIVINDKSQGSVATFVRYGGIFTVYVIANLLTSLPVKELMKIG